MQNVAAEFTIGQKKGVNAEFTIEQSQAIDTIFQIKAVPNISHLATKEELQETSDTINGRIDGVEETFNENLETLNDRVDTMVQEIEGSELIGVSREGQAVTITSQTFVFEQGVPSAQWQIVHNLNKYPSVALVDSSGRQFRAQIDYTDLNSLTVTMNGGITGKAYLN